MSYCNINQYVVYLKLTQYCMSSVSFKKNEVLQSQKYTFLTEEFPRDNGKHNNKIILR